MHGSGILLSLLFVKMILFKKVCRIKSRDLAVLRQSGLQLNYTYFTSNSFWMTWRWDLWCFWYQFLPLLVFCLLDSKGLYIDLTLLFWTPPPFSSSIHCSIICKCLTIKTHHAFTVFFFFFRLWLTLPAHRAISSFSSSYGKPSRILYLVTCTSFRVNSDSANVPRFELAINLSSTRNDIYIERDISDRYKNTCTFFFSFFIGF